MSRDKAAPTGYFDSVVNLMIKAGFALIAKVAINNSEVPFHVPAEYARTTSLFFHKVGKQLIVKLSFDENDSYRDFFYGAWSIDIDKEFLPEKELFPLIHIPASERGWDDPTFKEVPGMDTGLEFTGFFNYGSKWEESPAPQDRMDPERLVDVVVEETNKMLPYLDRGRFDRLQVTDFPPYYAFPGCEELFWSRFDRAYFRNIVRDPWGSSDQNRYLRGRRA